MPTNRFVESSFWNFDALFQPQQHPARDMHDTFFIKGFPSPLNSITMRNLIWWIDPATSDDLPKEYLEKVKQVHSKGGYESIGYGYDWKREEAEKLIMRTHTTAISSQMLYKLAQQAFSSLFPLIDKGNRKNSDLPSIFQLIGFSVMNPWMPLTWPSFIKSRV